MNSNRKRIGEFFSHSHKSSDASPEPLLNNTNNTAENAAAMIGQLRQYQKIIHQLSKQVKILEDENKILAERLAQYAKPEPNHEELEVPLEKCIPIESDKLSKYLPEKDGTSSMDSARLQSLKRIDTLTVSKQPIDCSDDCSITMSKKST